MEKKFNKTKALKELSPKQKASLNKKVGSLFLEKNKIKSRKVSYEKELRSLSPVEGKYKKILNNAKSSERSGSRNNSNKKSIEHIYSDKRDKKDTVRESLMTFGERTNRLLKDKELINSNDSRQSNKAKLKAKLNQAYSNAKTVDEYQQLLDRIFAEDLDLSSAGRSIGKINSSSRREFNQIEPGKTLINSLDIPNVKKLDCDNVLIDSNRIDTSRKSYDNNQIDTNRMDTNRLDTNRLIEKADNYR